HGTDRPSPLPPPSPAVAAASLTVAPPAPPPPLASALPLPSGRRPAHGDEPVLLRSDAPAPAFGVPASSAPRGAEPTTLQTAESPASPPLREPLETAMALASERLGLVRIGLEGGPNDLRVSLAASSPAAASLLAEAPRLAAELGAQGYRLHSLDVAAGGGASGGAGAGGQRAPGDPRRHMAPPPGPSAALPGLPATAAMSPAADRYA
ncbi:hypothetical protein IP88_01845, partial [alpha proteobacterium AAP81b]